LRERFSQEIIDVYDLFDLFTVVVKTDKIVEVCQFLRDDPQLRFNYLSDVCGADYSPKVPRFEVVYHVYSIPFKHRVRLKCRINEGERVPTVVGIWPTANWHERETYDMYGIEFEGHPDLRRIYLWEGFEGYPMRKDYPLKGYKDKYNPFGEEK
jgi:NADH-quinone oxidoreductase subunit C